MKKQLSAWYWIAWTAFSIGGFVILETLALTNSAPGDTLSERVWVLMEAAWYRIPFTIVFIGGCVWLIVHWFGPYISKKGKL